MIKKKNKKGWIKVVEAFIAIIFLVGVIFLVVSSEKFKKQEPNLYEEMAYEVLFDMQINDTIRKEIISQTDFDIDSNSTGFSAVLRDYLKLHEISGADCYTKVCSAIGDCLIDRDFDGDIFVSEILITSSVDSYSPRKVKMFCLSK